MSDGDDVTEFAGALILNGRILMMDGTMEKETKEGRNEGGCRDKKKCREHIHARGGRIERQLPLTWYAGIEGALNKVDFAEELKFEPRERERRAAPKQSSEIEGERDRDGGKGECRERRMRQQ